MIVSVPERIAWRPLDQPVSRTTHGVFPMRISTLLFVSTLILLCAAAAGHARQDIDRKLIQVIKQHGLSGDPSLGRLLPSIEDPIAKLGKLLFFSKSLGGDMDTACVSCHHPALGGADRLSLSVGVAADKPEVLGPGRKHSATGFFYDGGPTVPRNSPSTFNIALWDRALFHDGRVESLSSARLANGTGGPIRTPDAPLDSVDPEAGNNLVAAQARFPVTSPEEMRGFTFEEGEPNDRVRAELASRLAHIVWPAELPKSSWLDEFRAAFQRPAAAAEELITFNNIAFAIGEYERSQRFVDTPWRRYVKGDRGAISHAAKAGALLFFTDYSRGGFNCAACHSGDFFTDEEFHVLATPQIGRGKGDDNGFTATDDFGRERVTGDAADRYAFRTPTLVNVALTAPYGHAGAYATLEAVIQHHLRPIRSIYSYDFRQLGPNIQTQDMFLNTGLAGVKLIQEILAGRSPLRPRNATETQISRVAAFLQTLTDACAASRECLSPWIAGDSDPDPDGLRLVALDGEGGEL